VVADARLARRLAGRPDLTGSRWRTAAAIVGLTASSPRFAALLTYRLRTAALRRGWVVVPALLHHVSALTGGLVVGGPSLLRGGVWLEGPVVIDGISEVGEGCIIGGGVTLGLVDGMPFGPTLGRGVTVGPGAKVVGLVRVGDGARIAPGSVVVRNVAAGTTVAGVPAVEVDPSGSGSSGPRDRAPVPVPVPVPVPASDTGSGPGTGPGTVPGEDGTDRPPRVRFRSAVRADLAVTARYRHERWIFRSPLDVAVQAARLSLVTDAFFAQVCVRAATATEAAGARRTGRVLRRLAGLTGGVEVDPEAELAPGLYLPHGRIRVRGRTRVAGQVVLRPFLTLEPSATGGPGPVIGGWTLVGTGARVVGPVRLGERVNVGANAVVTTDVPDDMTAVGVPAVWRPRSDVVSPELQRIREVIGFNAGLIEEFRANDGVVGGSWAGFPLLLLHTRGARSGAARVTPLGYLDLGDGSLAIFASFAGEPRNPDWYHNLLAHPDVVVEIGADTRAVRAREVRGAERDRIWSRQKAEMPLYAAFEARTDRVIPVVVLEPRA
jgi:deazaflavin-dependent oxidoreductase (nitroreductase family)